MTAPPPKKVEPKPPVLRALRRPLTVAFLIALVVHLPVTPLFPLLRVLKRVAVVREQPKDWDYEKKPDLSLPIELLELPKPVEAPERESDNSFAVPSVAGEAAAAKAAKAASDEKKAAEAKKAAEEKAAEQKQKQGGGGEAAKKASVKFAKPESPDDEEKDDGDKTDDGFPSKSKKKSKGKDKRVARLPDEAPQKEAPKETVGLRGALNDKVVGKPNVTLAMWFGPVREHPLAGTVDKLFSCAPEWKPLRAQGVVPLTDVEGMLVVGEQLSDPSGMTVALQHTMSGERLKGLADGLVAASGERGGWVKDGVAKVVIARKDRVVFEHPRDMIFMAPTTGWEPLHDTTEPLALPPAKGRALSLTLQKPARPLKRLGVSLPARLTEMRLDVFANADGSADVQIDFDEESDAMALADAPQVSRTLSQLFSDLSQVTQTVDVMVRGEGDAKLRLPDVDFDPVGKRIAGAIHFAPAQTSKMLSLLSRIVCPKPKAGKPGGGGP